MERMKYLNRDGRGELAPMNAITVLDFDKGVVFRYDTITDLELERGAFSAAINVNMPNDGVHHIDAVKKK